jgi:uncharacterized protein (DUF1778 family)
MSKFAAKEQQISAFVSSDTKERLEKYVRQRGVKKGYVIEQALTQYLSAVDQIPEEYLIPTRIVLTNESFDKMIDLVENPPKPTKALRDLMKRAKKYMPK